MSQQRCYVTTSIPYVNGRPHVGHALELVQADAIARYRRLVGCETRFQTGADENALKNVLAAREEGIATQALVDRNSGWFRDLCDALDASPDAFLRTTEPRHGRAVECLWRRLRPGDLYRRHYTGLYCTGCEDFYLEKDLVDGRCPEHGTPPVPVKEENWFFRLSAYQRQIEDLLTSEVIRVTPESRRNEVLSFVRGGLADISVSRASERSGGWGIPVPDDPSQVVYVWIDALVNYVSGLGYGADDGWDRFWDDGTTVVHVIGKNVWKFHAVYWPALLLSAGLALPDEIVVHGFLTVEGRKIGKSLGNAIDPFACVETLGVDAVRYYLLRGVSPFGDGDFSTARAAHAYNTDLANGLGNLVSRLTTLAERSGYGRLDRPTAPDAPDGYHEAARAYRFDAALGALWAALDRLNQDIERVRPWKALKAGETASLHGSLSRWFGELHAVAYWLRPFLPSAGERVLAALREKPVRASRALFPRLERVAASHAPAP